MKLYQFWNYDLAEAAETWIDELLEQEEWFSYTLPEVAGNSISFRITIEGTVMEEIPYPMILKCRGNQADTETVDIERLNQRLKELFYVTYGFPESLSQRKLYEKIDAGNIGFLGNRHPINNPENIKKCADSKMREFVAQLSDRLFSTVKDNMDEDGNIIWTEEVEPKAANHLNDLKQKVRQTAFKQFMPEQRDELQKCAAQNRAWQLLHFKVAGV